MIKDKISLIQKKIIQGDEEAFALLYESYFKKLCCFGMQISELSAIEIDDFVQEIFIWLSENNDKLSSINNLETYLFISLRRNIQRELSKRKLKEKSKKSYFSVCSNQIEEVASQESKLIEEESREIRNSGLKQVMDSLPPTQKQVIYLRNYMNLNYREIAEIMNVTEQVARNYAHRGLAKMKKCYATDSLLKVEDMGA